MGIVLRGSEKMVLGKAACQFTWKFTMEIKMNVIIWSLLQIN